MVTFKKYYGAAVLDEKDLLDTDNKNGIILEYYKVKRYVLNNIRVKTSYGITIVKKEYSKEKVRLEKKSIKNISTSESKIKGIIDILKSYKVTPIALNDVLADLLKQPEFQGE